MNPPTASDVFEEVEALNRAFEYDAADAEDPEFWYDVLEAQLAEIREHLDEGRRESAHDEFADCVLVAVKALMESDPRNHRETISRRAKDVRERVDAVQREYEREYGGPD